MRCSGWLQLVFSALLVVFSAAEKYYEDYDLYVAANRSVTATVNQCVAWCLASVSCIAVSVCELLSGVLCSVATCGNIQVVSSSGCKIILFHDLNFYDQSTTPLYEWIMTDNCGGNSFPNTGTNTDTPLVVNGNLQLTPSASTFYGNAMAGSGVKFSVSSVPVSNSAKFSLFYWFKFLSQTSETFNLADLTYTSPVSGRTMINPFVSFQHNSGHITVNNYITPCPPDGCSVTLTKTISDGLWHNLAVTFDANSKLLQLSIDGKLCWSGSRSITLSTISVQTGAVSTTTTTNFALYCYKIYNITLSSSDLNNLAQTCLAGKVTVVVPTPVAITSVGDTSWLAMFPLYSTMKPNQQNYSLFCNLDIPAKTLTWSTAKAYCQSLGFQLAQPASTTSLADFFSVLQTLTTGFCIFPWIGANYNSTISNYAWTESKATISDCNVLRISQAAFPNVLFWNNNCWGKAVYHPQSFACSSQNS